MNKLKLCDQSVEEHIKDENSQVLPDSPVLRTQHFHCRGLGSTPGQGTKILEATQRSQEKENKNSLYLDPCLITGGMIHAPNQGQNGGAPAAPPLCSEARAACTETTSGSTSSDICPDFYPAESVCSL